VDPKLAALLRGPLWDFTFIKKTIDLEGSIEKGLRSMAVIEEGISNMEIN
jgi:hypothetical protein